MNVKNNIFVSAVAMIDVDSRILISNRKNRKQFSNYWEFPGGKIENNETNHSNNANKPAITSGRFNLLPNLTVH